MKRLIVVFLVMAGVFFQRSCFASGFNLKSIGQVNTDGRQISHWWYSGVRPVFHGEAAPSSVVTADIDGQATNINADSSGNWDYQPVNALTAGDHQVSFKNDGSEIKFTLTLGAENVNWDSIGKESSGSTLPTAGGAAPTLVLLVSGIGAVVIGKRFLV